MSNIKVHNINGTSGRKPNDGSDDWLDFWEAHHTSTVTYCQDTSCTNKKEVGAHVQKDGKDDDKYWYIVPLCKACNAKTVPFSVPENMLVRITDTN